jgi:hypothetical protein
MKLFKYSGKLFSLILSSALVFAPLNASAAPHYYVPATELGISGDPYYQQYVNENGLVPFTVRLNVAKHENYPIGIYLTIDPYIGAMCDYLNTHDDQPISNISKLNPKFSLSGDTPAEVEQRYLALNGRELPDKDLNFFEIIAVDFVNEEHRCVDFEEARLTELPPEEAVHIYDRKCAIEENTKVYFQRAIAEILDRADY